MIYVHLLAAALATVLPARLAAQASQDRPMAITHVTLIDATGVPPQDDMTVVVTRNRISAIGRSVEVAIPASAQMVDGTGLYMVPGLIDTHVHLFGDWTRTTRERAEAYLGGFLAQGVTGLREALGDEFRLELRDAIGRGQILGPHLYVSGEVSYAGVQSDGVDDVRALTRRRITQGFDGIKVRSQLKPQDVLAVIDEARSQGVPVYGHTTYRDTLPWVDYTLPSVHAGLSGVMHTWFLPTVADEQRPPAPTCGWRECAAAWWLYHASLWLFTTDQDTEALIRSMVQRQVWLEPTLTFTDPIAHHDRYREEDPEGWYDWYQGPDLTRFRAAFDEMKRFVRRFHEAGGVVLAGTDNVDYPLRYELRLLSESGLSPLAVVQAATRNAARALGWAERLGTVEVGKEADLLLLEADPLDDLRNFERIRMVVRAGQLLEGAALKELDAKAKAAASAAKR